jgi:N-carbamoyl-L-amino-acid hydrolase
MGRIELHPNLINVVPARATATVDLRNTDETVLRLAEGRFVERCDELARAEGVTIERRRLARFEPVTFDERLVELVERAAVERRIPVMRLPSGAGHDAQMFARICPTAMVFVPSRAGISHNPAEFTSRDEIDAGLRVLTDVMLGLALERADEARS